MNYIDPTRVWINTIIIHKSCKHKIINFSFIHSFIQDDYMVNANCGHSAKTTNMFGLKMCTN